MPKFNDSENLQPQEIIPAGDYKFEVVDFKSGIQSGGKTAGSEKYELKAEVHFNGIVTTINDLLIDHESCAWKIDTFLKCCGVKLEKGERFEFSADAAADNDCSYINPIGLRGWCRVIVDSYRTDKMSATEPDRKKNKIQTYYTDKEKLKPNQTAAEDSVF